MFCYWYLKFIFFAVIFFSGLLVIVFNATFNNISAISWRSVLLVWNRRKPPTCELYAGVLSNVNEESCLNFRYALRMMKFGYLPNTASCSASFGSCRREIFQLTDSERKHLDYQCKLHIIYFRFLTSLTLSLVIEVIVSRKVSCDVFV